jgi:hypothetical protein
MKIKETSELELVGEAAATIGFDQSIEKKIAEKFNAFESDGESDEIDLDERL